MDDAAVRGGRKGSRACDRRLRGSCARLRAVASRNCRWLGDAMILAVLTMGCYTEPKGSLRMAVPQAPHHTTGMRLSNLD